MLSECKVPTRRSYQQHCGVARALDVVGERWTLLIVRDLFLGPRRYGELLDGLPGITTNLLAKRLRELTRAGLVEKQPGTPPAAFDVYALTKAGRELEPALMELGRWGWRLLATPRRGDVRNLGWALLSLKRRYRGGLVAVVEIREGRRCFELSFGEERLEVTEKPSERAVARLSAADQQPFFELFFVGTSAMALEGRGVLTVQGDRAVVRAALAALGASLEPQGPAKVDAEPQVS
jgi:DNA-binding HxlR family transcriptional regulator